MKLTLCLAMLLAISAYGNFVLWNRTAAPPDEPIPAPAAKKTKLTAIDTNKVGPNARSRFEELNAGGLARDHAIAAIEPELSQRLRGRYMRGDSPAEIMRAGKTANSERRQLIEDLSGGQELDENVFDSHEIRLRFEFEPPRDEAHKLKRRDSGRGESSSSRDSTTPHPGDRGIHEVLRRIGGVTLTQEQKAQLVEIAQANHNDPEARAIALGEAFEPERAAQLVRCFEPGYPTAYRRATSVSEDPDVRLKFAAALHEYVQMRDHPQRQERLLEALGQDGVEIIRAARW